MISMSKLTWARTIAGEARGEDYVGQLAVGFVPFNRSKISGKGVVYECLKRYQFSCWNTGDPNKAIIIAMNEVQLLPFLHVVDNILTDAIDITNGATFYHTSNISPVWSHGHTACAIIGHHIFYNNIAPYLVKR